VELETFTETAMTDVSIPGAQYVWLLEMED
jgi:hypothetical protein